MFYQNEGTRLTGINHLIKNTVEEIVKIKSEYSYYALEGNYLNLPLLGPAVTPQFMNLFMHGKQADMLANWYDVSLIHSYFWGFDMMVTDAKKILTIHDLLPLTCPLMESEKLTPYFEKNLQQAAQQADKIIAVSNYTKTEIIACYGVSEEKINVVYPGVRKRKVYPDKKVFSKYGLENGKYLLATTTWTERKNIDGLINAFVCLKNRHKDCDLKLVIVGRPGWKADYNSKVIDMASKAGSEVALVGYVTNEELEALYESCLACAYVSLYEGFGLPVLEAMQYGKAVVTSNCTSMPEAGGDAAIYCNPYEIEAIAEALETVVYDEEKREESESKGKIHAQKFSWKKSAEDTLKLYQTLQKD